MPFHQLWLRIGYSAAKPSPFLVDLSAVLAIGRLETFGVALLIGDDWQHMHLRSDPSEALPVDEGNKRYDFLIEAWKEARQKLQNPLFVGNVSYVPSKDV